MNFEWLAGTDTIIGTWLHTMVYVALLVWVFTRRRAEDERGWRDLRLWVVPLVTAQILLYWIF
jgi:isoprenylcysteine carboxyl methyltransferase (ICMT) family protein YpbQ